MPSGRTEQQVQIKKVACPPAKVAETNNLAQGQFHHIKYKQRTMVVLYILLCRPVGSPHNRYK
jgi:hypothetical protein